MLENNYINNKFRVGVVGYVFVSEDNVHEGEIQEVNSWGIPEKEFIVQNLGKEELKQVKSFIVECINDVLFEKLKADEILDKVDIYENEILYSQQCNNENLEPTPEELEAFRQGNINLYSQDMSFRVTINDIDISFEDLNTIMRL